MENEELVQEKALNPRNYLQDLVRRAKERQVQTNAASGGLQGLSTMVGAMSGVKPDVSMFQEQRKQAAEDVESGQKLMGEEEKARQLLAQVRAKAQAEKEATKPSYKESTSAIGEKGEPLIFSEGRYFNPDLTPYVGKVTSIPKERMNITVSGQEKTQARHESNLAQRKAQWEQKYGWDRTKNLNDRVSKLQDKLSKGNTPQYEVAKTDVQSMLGSKDTAYGRLASLPPTWMLSPEGQKFRGAVERLIAPIRKDLFGATLTEGEQDSFRTMVGTGKGMSLEAFEAALNKIIEAQDAEVENIYGYDPQATEELSLRKGGAYVKAPSPSSSKATQSLAPDEEVKNGYVFKKGAKPGDRALRKYK